MCLLNKTLGLHTSLGTNLKISFTSFLRRQPSYGLCSEEEAKPSLPKLRYSSSLRILAMDLV